MSTKVYLGDGCYASFDGYAIWLTTDNGMRETNRICLDPEVYAALVMFRDSLVRPAKNDGGAG